LIFFQLPEERSVSAIEFTFGTRAIKKFAERPLFCVFHKQGKAMNFIKENRV